MVFRMGPQVKFVQCNNHKCVKKYLGYSRQITNTVVYKNKQDIPTESGVTINNKEIYYEM